MSTIALFMDKWAIKRIVTKTISHLVFHRTIALLLLLLLGNLSQALGEIQFEEVTTKAGFNYFGQTWGASWGDYNGDGYPDLWLSNHQLAPSLYRNNRDGTFTEVGGSVFLEPINPKADTHGAMWADIDNDGDQDIFEVTGGGASSIYCANKIDPVPNWLNHLYISSKEGLVDQAEQYGLALGHLRSRTPLFLDFTYDGLLDVIIGTANGDYCNTTALHQEDDHFNDVTSVVDLHTNGCLFLTLADLSGNNIPYVLCKEAGIAFPDYIYDVGEVPFNRIDGILPHVSSGLDLAVEDFDGNGELDLLVTGNARTGKVINNSSALQIDSRQINARFVISENEHAITFKSDSDIHVVLSTDFPNVSPTDVFIGSDGHHPIDEDPYWVEFAFTLSPDDPGVAGDAPRPDGIENGIYIDYDPVSNTWTLTAANSSSSIWKIGARIIGDNSVSELGLVGFSQPPPNIGNAPKMFLNYGFAFVDDTTNAGLTEASHCESVSAGDFDNDMDMDLYLVCFNLISNLENVLYQNQSQGVFTQVQGAGGAGGSDLGIGESVVTADYDQDGCLDIFVSNGYWSPPFYNGPHQLFHNTCMYNDNHWLEIDLEGVISNRDAIGAKVVAIAGGVTQVRMLNGGMHKHSQNHQRLHFGLGQNKHVDQLTVYWPNGLIQEIYNVPADQLIRITEDTHPSVIGKPLYTAALSDGVYLWKDTGTNNYHLRVSAPVGSRHKYIIKLISDSDMSTVLPVKLEPGDDLRVEDNGFVFTAYVSGGEDGVDLSLPVSSEALLSVEKDGNVNPRTLHVGASGLPIMPVGWIKNASSMSPRPRVSRGSELGLFIGKRISGTDIEVRWSGDGNNDRVNHQSRFQVLTMKSLRSATPVGLELGDSYLRTDNSLSVTGVVANGWDGLNFAVDSGVEIGFVFEQDGLLPYHHVNHGALGDLGFPNAYRITGYD